MTYATAVYEDGSPVEWTIFTPRGGPLHANLCDAYDAHGYTLANDTLARVFDCEFMPEADAFRWTLRVVADVPRA